MLLLCHIVRQAKSWKNECGAHFCAVFRILRLEHVTRSMRSRYQKHCEERKRSCQGTPHFPRVSPLTLARRWWKKMKFHPIAPNCLRFSTNDALNKPHRPCGHIPREKYLWNKCSRWITPPFPRLSLSTLGRCWWKNIRKFHHMSHIFSIFSTSNDLNQSNGQCHKFSKMFFAHSTPELSKILEIWP